MGADGGDSCHRSQMFVITVENPKMKFNEFALISVQSAIETIEITL